MKKLVMCNRRAILAGAILLIAAAHADGAIVVTSQGPMAQINTAGLPGTHIRDLSTLWDASDSSNGTIFFVQSATTPLSISRSATVDGGLTWMAGVDTGLLSPVSVSPDERNPVVRDFDQNGNLVGLFGSKQGVNAVDGINNLLFRATSANNGTTWLGESLVTFNVGAFSGNTGLNGFIEVFKTSTGILRGYTAMNNLISPGPSATHRVESSDNGATWTDMGNISIPSPSGAFNIVGANGPVFTFTDNDTSAERMGWFVFGEGSGNRGVNFLVSDDEGLTWTSGGFSFLNASIRSGDANFISDTEVRLFYYLNAGTIPSDRQLWYEDFTLSGMSDIQPNNLLYQAGPEAVPEPATLALLGLGGLVLLRHRRGKIAN